MECASLAAVAEYNALTFGSLFYFTDLLSGTGWDWRFYDKVIGVAIILQIINICF